MLIITIFTPLPLSTQLSHQSICVHTYMTLTNIVKKSYSDCLRMEKKKKRRNARPTKMTPQRHIRNTDENASDRSGVE